ncbi:hypothetical protein JCM21900_005434 [Sporobolomyces salmonicolor]
MADDADIVLSSDLSSDGEDALVASMLGAELPARPDDSADQVSSIPPKKLAPRPLPVNAPRNSMLYHAASHKAARKTTSRATGKAPMKRAAKNVRMTNKAQPSSSSTAAPSLRLILQDTLERSSKNFREAPKDPFLHDLPFPFSIEARLEEVRLARRAAPFPRLVQSRFSIAFRHATQSWESAARCSLITSTHVFPKPTSLVDEHVLLTERDIPIVANLQLNSYPCPPSSNDELVELMLHFELSEMDGERIFAGAVPLTNDGRVSRRGRGKSRRIAEGETVKMSWELRALGSGAEGSVATTETVRAAVEEKMREFESARRKEVAKREIIFNEIAPRTQPMLYLPSGFAPTPSLIPHLDDPPITDPPASFPSFEPLPRFQQIAYTTRAVPYDGSPLESYPLLSTWEDSASTNAYVEAKVGDIMNYEPESDDDEATRQREEEWRKENMVSRRALEGLDNGSVQRDFAALGAMIGALGIDKADLAQAAEDVGLEGGASSWQELLCRDRVLEKACKLYGERTGQSGAEAQHRFRLLSEAEAVPIALTPDVCQMCGALFCTAHDRFKSFNKSTMPPPRAPPIADGGCPQCGSTRCLKDKVATSPRSNSDQERAGKLLAEGHPSIDPCSASLILERPFYEASVSLYHNYSICLSAEKADFLVQIAAHSGVALAYSAPQPRPMRLFKRGTNSNYLPPDSSKGYFPCSCTGTCDDDCSCVTGSTFCDGFCGCSRSCRNRHRGCTCHRRGKSATESCCEHSEGCWCKNTNRACDPAICGLPLRSCHNLAIQQQQHKATQLGTSTLPCGGFGLFMVETAEKGDVLGVYGGESFAVNLENWDESAVYGVLKEALSERILVSYWFTLDDSHAVDSNILGSNMRFINHSTGRSNCVAGITYVSGTHQIAITATKSLQPGEELFLDYGQSYGDIAGANIDT